MQQTEILQTELMLKERKKRKRNSAQNADFK